MAKDRDQEDISTEEALRGHKGYGWGRSHSARGLEDCYLIGPTKN